MKLKYMWLRHRRTLKWDSKLYQRKCHGTGVHCISCNWLFSLSSETENLTVYSTIQLPGARKSQHFRTIPDSKLPREIRSTDFYRNPSLVMIEGILDQIDHSDKALVSIENSVLELEKKDETTFSKNQGATKIFNNHRQFQKEFRCVKCLIKLSGFCCSEITLQAKQWKWKG